MPVFDNKNYYRGNFQIDSTDIINRKFEFKRIRTKKWIWSFTVCGFNKKQDPKWINRNDYFKF
jgi:hypothetical protein